MRLCDDIADDPKLSLPDRRQKLDTWLDALHRAQQGQPTDDAILLALTGRPAPLLHPAGLLDELARAPPWTLNKRNPPRKALPLPVSPSSIKLSKIFASTVIASPPWSVWFAFTSSGIVTPQRNPSLSNAVWRFKLTQHYSRRERRRRSGACLSSGRRSREVQSFRLRTTDRSRPRPLSPCARSRRPIAPASSMPPEDALIPFITEDSQPALW